jgi:hypothetical protein
MAAHMTDQPWTRATTVANTLADRYGLEAWAQRNTVLGLGLRQDLYALAVSCTAEDKEELNRIVGQAQEAAKSRSGANLGTALHRLTERIDTGEELNVPDAWRPDIDAYCQTLVDHHVQIHSEYIERIVVVPELRVAGTLDRLVTIGGTLTVSDLKTGKDAVTYGAGEIAAQLALYSRATHMWKGSADAIKRDRYGRYMLPDPAEFPAAYDVMPAVDQSQALVIHLPVGKAQCHLHTVDLEAGWEAVLQAMWVREWRKRKDLAAPFSQWKETPQLTLVSTGTDDDW